MDSTSLDRSFDALLPAELLTSDLETARRARLLVRLMAVAILIALVMCGVITWRLEAETLVAILSAGVILGLGSFLFLRLTRRLGAAMVLGGLVMYATITAIAIRQGGLDVPVLMWSFALPILASLQRARGRVVLWLALILLQITGLFAAQLCGWLPPRAATDSLADLCSLLAFLAFIACGTISSLRLQARSDEERRRMERRVSAAERMESLGRFAGGVAHDFNNILTIVHASAEFGLQSLPGPAPARSALETILKAADRGAALARQVLAFSRSEVAERAVFDLNRLISDARSVLGGLVPENIRLEIELAGGPVHVRAIPAQLERAIMNLVTNAVDAMRTGGALRIATDTIHVGDGTEVRPGRYARLSVEDTGPAISPEDLPRLFEPFYISRGRSRGTGMGLSVVYGIVRESEGTVSADSLSGQGARFRILLPLLPAPPPQPVESDAPPAVAASSRGEPVTVLLVEDQESLVMILSRVLLQRGYRVHTALNGDQALALWTGCKNEVDLLLTDVVLPGMAGTEVARRMLADRPDLKVLYTSGYTNHHLASRDLGPNAGFLEKPFKTTDLLKRVEALLGNRVPPPTS
jgi:signal transduction histidine kinase/ActR/RegA family two-component response regulator